MKDVAEFAKGNLMPHDASSFQAGEGFLKTLEMCMACFKTNARDGSNAWRVCMDTSDAVFAGMEAAGVLPTGRADRKIVLWSGVDDFGKGFAEAKEAIALARLPMDRVLTILTGLEAQRRAYPGAEWETQNWEEHTLRPWEAVSKSLVRWGEQANKLTIYVVLKKFSTGAVFWETEMTTLCSLLRARKESSENVIMDVRLHEKFDEMQEKQREESVSKVGALFGGVNEIPKEKWTALTFTPFKVGKYEIAPQGFDAIWKEVTSNHGDVPNDAELTVAGVKALATRSANEQFPLASKIKDILKDRLEKDCAAGRHTLTVREGLRDDYGSVDDIQVDALFHGANEINKKDFAALTFTPFKVGKHEIAPGGFDAIWKKVHPDNNGDVLKDAKLTVTEVKELANVEL